MDPKIVKDALKEAASDAKIKAALKEGLKEWMDEQLALFGKWSLMGIGSMILAGLIYLFLVSSGHFKP